MTMEKQSMPTKRDPPWSVLFDWVDFIWNCMALLSTMGTAGVFLVIGLWPGPLKMQPGTLPFNQAMVRAVALAGCLGALIGIKGVILLMKKRRKHAD